VKLAGRRQHVGVPTVRFSERRGKPGYGFPNSRSIPVKYFQAESMA